MMRRVLSIAAALAVCSCLVARGQSFTYERLAADHWRITVANDEPGIVPPAPDRAFSRVIMPGYFPRLEPGAPQLPVKALRFDLPPGGTVAANITGVREMPMHAQLIPFAMRPAGAPAAPLRAARTASTAVPALDAPRYGDDNGIRTATLLFNPVRYDAAARELVWIRSAVIDVRIPGATGAAVAAGRVAVEPGAAINASDAAAWRAMPKAAAAARWFQPGVPMLRITTGATGVYRLTYADLLATGMPLNGLDPHTIRIVVDGAEIPIIVRGEADGVFDATDAVEFYLARRAGQAGEYFDEWSDANTAWMLWGGQAGLRMTDEDGTPATLPELAALPVRLHIEEDHVYHAGDNDYESAISEKVPGETWVWTYLRRYDSLGVKKLDSLVVPVTLDGVAPGPSALTYRIKGSSRDQSLIAIDINGVQVERTYVDSDQILTRTVTVPAGAIVAGSNRLVIRTLGAVDCPPETPNCSIERVYVDWFSLQYAAPPRADHGAVLYDPSAAIDTIPAGSRVHAALTGFRDTSVTIIDVTRGAVVRNARITRTAGDSARAEFSMNASDAYHVRDGAAALRPDTITLTAIPDPALSASGADYIIVTAAPFMQAARRLAAYRAAVDTFRTAIVDVADAYNAYTFGHKHPDAIRDLLRDAYFQWPAPAPRFVVMLGDASWDPKFHMDNSRNVDYVPTNGNPADDNDYVAIDSLAPHYPKMSIGRIPAQTAADADQVVDKIMAYESATPQPWNRRMLFAIGGKNTFERDTLFKPQIDGMLRRWVEPHCVEPVKILKSRLDIVSYNDLDTLISEVNRGVLWFHFVGHGGTRIIDMGVERPDIFATKDRYPFFVTLSCNTAHFAEPYETGLNEKFTMARENGAIATYGTSGLGVVSYDEVLADNLFKAVFDKSIRTYGGMSTDAKRAMLDAGGLSSQFAINTVNQYIVLGDPATHIALTTTPELAVGATDVTTDPEILVESRPTAFTTRVHNNGMCLLDSVDVVFTIAQGATVLSRQTRRIEPFTGSVDLVWNEDLARVTGSIRIGIAVDPDDRIHERVKIDNTVTVDRTVLPRGMVPVFPLDAAVLSSDSATVRLVVANPAFVPAASLHPVVQYQLAKDAAFTAPWQTIDVPAGLTYTAADWTAAPAQSRLWYWRARMTSSAGTEDWSAVRSFALDAPAGAGEQWRQTTRAQFATGVLDALTAGDDNTVRCGTRPAVVEVVSAGNNQIEIQDFAEIRIDGVNFSPNHRGFNLAVIDPDRGRILDTASFDTYADRDLAARMAAYLRNVAADRLVAIAIRDDANGAPDFTIGRTNITTELRSALKLFGAQYADSIGFRDSYALLGRKDNPAAVREMYRSYGPAFFKDTITVRADRGVMRSPVIGPAGRWDTFRWNGASGAASSVVLNVYRAGGASDSLVWSSGPIAAGTDASLSSISAAACPFIRAEAVLADSTQAGTPALNGWNIRFQSVFGECGINNQSVELVRDTVEQGADAEVDLRIPNAGRADVVSLPVRLTVTGAGGQKLQRDLAASVRKDEVGALTFTVPTAGMSGEGAFEVRLDPAATRTEYYTGNNVFTGRLYVAGDRTKPTLDVEFDGAVVVDGDYVSPKPVITVLVRDKSPLPILDTAAVQMFMDGRRIWTQGNPEVAYRLLNTGDDKVRVEYRPTLDKGYHAFSASARDASGNPADTIPYDVRFFVSSDNKLEQLYPYPNPASGPVDFTFVLQGGSVPEEVRIRIYTVAGRLIREITTRADRLHIGFNRIAWDGRDQDDDVPGNGVYFYRVLVRRPEGTEELTGKLSVLR